MDALNFVLAHWGAITNVALGLALLIMAVKNKQWDRLLVIAAEITDDVGELVGADNAEKRKMAADALWDAAGPIAQKLFTKEQMAQIVDIAWHTITKPAQKADGHGPA